MIEASFGQYLINQDLSPHYEERMRIEHELEQVSQSFKGQPKEQQRMTKLAERLKNIERLIERETTKYWRNFQAIANILKVSGYLDANKPTDLGHLAQGIRGSNELFLTEVCISGLLENLAADELAAVLTALVTESNRYDERSGKPVYEPVSPQIDYTLGEISKIARRIVKVQRDFSIDIPVQFGPTFCYLSQKWAQGASWDDMAEIARAKRMDEGDIVRVVRRTLDLCRQFKRAASMNEALVKLCAQTELLIDRDEINEDV